MATTTALTGMHTYEDAFILVRGQRLTGSDVSILDAAPTVMQLVGEPIPAHFAGQSLLA